MKSGILVLLLLLAQPIAAQQALTNAHAHNDYRHARPLLDALDRGFCSVEADVFPVGDDLLVGHDRKDIRSGKDLLSMYLRPIGQMVRDRSSIFSLPGARLTLLVDVKAGGERACVLLGRQLEAFAPMLTRFRDGVASGGPVTVIVSGERPVDFVSRMPDRLFALDGRLPELTNGAPVHVFPLVSESWASVFRWRGEGELPETDARKLNSLADAAHLQGRRIRFWGAPDNPATWKACRDAGVDLINTDKLDGLASFLRGDRVAEPSVGDGQ